MKPNISQNVLIHDFAGGRDDLDMKLTWEWFTALYFIAIRLVVRTRENDKSYEVLSRLDVWRFLFVLFLLFCVLRTAVTLVDPRPGYLAQDQWWTDRLQQDRWADVASQQYVHFVLYFSWNELFKFFETVSELHICCGSLRIFRFFIEQTQALGFCCSLSGIEKYTAQCLH